MTYRTIISLVLLGSALLFAPAQLLAVSDYREDVQNQANAFLGPRGLGAGESVEAPIVVALLIRYALALIGTLFLAYGVYAGYTLMTSAGDEEKVSRAKNTLRTATIGVIVVLSAYSITVLVSTLFDLTEEPPDAYIEVDIESTDYQRARNPRPQELY